MARPILIIEDDPDIAEVLRYSLEAQRFETRVALTGNEGLSASLDKDRPPLLILLDLLLPGMNGLEICRRVRREPATARIPIIMVTAKASHADFINAKAAGVDDYVTKPFSVRKVLERIGALLSAETSLALPQSILSSSAKRTEREHRGRLTRFAEASWS